MAIGTQLNPGSINGRLSALAIRWQQLANDTLAFTGPVTSLGSAGLQGLTPVGFSAGDATLMLTAAAQLATLAGVYYGTATAPVGTNYDATFLTLRGTG